MVLIYLFFSLTYIFILFGFDLKSIWFFFNQSFISSIIGASLISYFLHLFIKQNEVKNLNKNAREILLTQNKNNSQIIVSLKSSPREVLFIPFGPFEISGYQIILNNFIHSFNIERQKQILDLVQEMMTFNDLYKILRELSMKTDSDPLLRKENINRLLDEVPNFLGSIEQNLQFLSDSLVEL